ncbi:FAD-dependent oxidoreductase [Chloroflexi bacterium TSY]|nr:FAD-dependent oxidoreductase [Chloroflexi bacterium TSY]
MALEPYIMNTTGNLFQSSQSFDGKPQIYRQIKNDTRGYIAELLAKAVDQGALDTLVTDIDERIMLIELLESFGPLNKETNKYDGSTRSGCAVDGEGRPTPNVFTNCQIPQRLPLNELLESKFWNESFYDPLEFEWQPTLFQPAGGMDMIVKGFLRKVGHLITYNAPVDRIQVEDDHVVVQYRDGQDQMTKRADYCISNIPCPILAKIENNFSDNFAKAVNNAKFASSCKVGWQTNTRFWESDKYEIYGGISWTDDIIEQIWYPSNDYFKQKGTLTGAYIHDGSGHQNATDFGKKGLAERLEIAKEGGAKLHDEFNNNTIVPTELGLSIAWQNVPYMAGAWPSWGRGTSDHIYYRELLKPDRRFYIVGDQASTLPGWQEGAMMSAEHVIELITGLKSESEIPAELQAPNTFKVTQGHGQ